MQLQLFVLSVLILLAGVAILFSTLRKPMKTPRRVSYGFIIISLLIFIAASLIQVDEGDVLVLTQFGKVYKTITTPGVHFKYPWAAKHVYPKRLKSKKLSIAVRSLDGMEIHIDVTTQYKVNSDKVGAIYKDIAKDVTILENNFIYPELRKSIRDSIARLSAKGIYSNREKLNDSITADARKKLSRKHTIIRDVLLREIKLPDQVEQAIEMKIKAQQEAEATEYKKEKAVKEAEIKEIEAQGLAKAQRIISTTLTSKYLQHEAIKAYTELTKSTNTTFVIMPTGTKGTGMPLILGNN
ncbi:MAG TPA: prohibitin family protein [Spirochaetota bacterium]|nr:prohibitin family protein [Spirochaetota bacterium]